MIALAAQCSTAVRQNYARPKWVKFPFGGSGRYDGSSWSPAREIAAKVVLKAIRHTMPRRAVEVAVGSSRLRFQLDGPGIGHMLAIRGFRELDQLKIMQRTLQAGDTCLEVGGNIGYYVALISSILSKHCDFVIFEPDERAYRALLDNIEINDLTDMCRVIPLAVGDANAETILHRAARWHLTSLQQSTITSREYSDTVSVATVDIIDALRLCSRPPVMRMDIEGYEERLFDRLAATSDDDVPLPRAIIFEPHTWEYRDPARLSASLTRLSEMGYKVAFAGAWEEGASRLRGLGYTALERFSEAGRSRSIFGDVRMDDAARMIVQTGGLTTVCLLRQPAICMADA